MMSFVSKVPRKYDSLYQYLIEIGRTKLLTADEEKMLAHQLREGNLNAKNRLIECNLRLVVCIARRYINRGLSLSDIIEEGNLGLIHAVEKFDPDVGARFSTYATWWIRQGIERAIMNQSKMIRLPIHLAKKHKQYLRMQHKLVQSGEIKPSVHQIASEMEVTDSYLQDLLALDRQEFSIDAAISDDQDLLLSDTLADHNIKDPVESIMDESMHNLLEKSLASLNPREREIIEKRYGLHGFEVSTLENIGETTNLTRERVRQIQLNVLKQLRHRYHEAGINKDNL